MYQRSGVDKVRKNLMEKSMKELNDTKRKPFNPSLPLMSHSDSESADENKNKGSGMANPIAITDEDREFNRRKQFLNSPSVIDLSAS